MRALFLFVLFNFLTACVSYESSIPKGYTGEAVTISDTYSNKTLSSAHFFYVKEMNGKPMYNAVRSTNGASSGQGAKLVAVGYSRKVPKAKLTLKVAGEVFRAAPILYMFNADENYAIEGEIEFTPNKDEFYFVKGELSETYSAVWIEDIHGKVISKLEEGEKSDKAPELVVKSKVYDPISTESVNVDELSNINLGESSELVKVRLGEPTKVSVIEGNFFKRTRDKTVFFYEDIAQFVFNGGPDFIKIATVIEIIPVVGGGESNLQRLKKEMSSTDPKELREYAKKYYKSDYIYPNALDVISQKIEEELSSLNDQNTDAVAWLIRVIGRSKNSDYIGFLNDISAQTSSTKIKRYANKMIEELEK
ncbi:hypothetical protein [Shewanella woodyi]|uniref:hypothetical protein n=1 Tax=Shewanella woodyi TaxID=60961 RepID=UPI0007EADF81|nr:hypothetical protein [Shewanella woodyi]